MRTELDRILQEAGIDAIWVNGNLYNNPDMVYMTGIRHVNHADLFKRVGKEPTLFHVVDMEREEAAKSGMTTQAYFSQQPLTAYVKKCDGKEEKAIALRVKEAMAAYGLTEGTVAISGKTALGPFYAVLQALKPMLPNVRFKSFYSDSPFLKARMTKSADEVGQIRKMGQITTSVMRRVQQFLQGCAVKEEIIIHDDGQPVTVRDVKSRINQWLAALGADNPEATIFAIGRDGGIPHNTGNPDDVIMLGKPIVFDIFPCESGGGYFYDMTRTWCLGYAPHTVKDLYDTVLRVHHQIIDALKPKTLFTDYQRMACDLFAKERHTTLAEDKTTRKGYLHSIGHGLGLAVHEKPFSGATADLDDILKPGVVFTIEPGLYYPEEGMGMRIEDTIYLNEENGFEILADYPYDLVIPMDNKK